MSQVHLEKITPMNWHDVEDLHVGKDQNFLADNVSSLALAGVIREAGFHVYTFGIYLDEEPIGFAMIGYDIPFDDEHDEYEKYWFTRSSYFLWRFMIDERYQKRGCGTAALQCAIDFIKTRPCGDADYCVISYKPENEVAKNLYFSIGFLELNEPGYYEDGEERSAVLKL